MFTPGAVTAISQLFENALIEHGRSNPQEEVEVERVAMMDEGTGHLVVLNISSYLFRIVAVFEFGTDEASCAHMARLTRSAAPRLEGQALHDACSELVNMICGAVNRNLCTGFRHVGMSTPFVLERNCRDYLSGINPDGIVSFTATVNRDMQFGLTLCFCADRTAQVDFVLPRVMEVVADAGELELF
ncbi:hypothetical protein [Silvimonas iriomotensis]|uniref:Chemotaxis protein CheX n=1 Tax=Silvimonas iriomotensis TaxID=449662 RepID=A0ABQ2PCY0_9NEIS|nr:hypothetical protein [Silvimonas iriomotensis]GGP23101.1 hypothetical protein GCM10010970_31010 [Silvimonas iriomotensis]